MAHPRRRTTRSIVSTAFAGTLLFGAAACGGTDDASTLDAVDAAAAAAADPASAPAPATESTADAAPGSTTDSTADSTAESTPESTVEAPVATEPLVIEASPELTAFAEVNGDLVDDWSTQLATFGDQAIEHIQDVSGAPAAPSVAELSDELIEAIGPDTTDPSLVTLRSFATGASDAIGYAAAGDQDSALSIFLGLQGQADALTAVLDQIGV